jgi:hypothetical protein
VAKSGDQMKVKSEDSLWYCVDFSGTSGYVLKTEAQRYSEEESRSVTLSVSNQTLMIIGILILVMILVVIIFRTQRREIIGISCLLISKKKKW